MKRFLIIPLFLVSICCFAQDTIGMHLPVKDGRLVYEAVIEQPGKSKVDLYANARQWFVDYFKSSKDVIQNEDKDQGRIVGKGIILVPWTTFAGSGTYDCKITIQIDVKENKYRYKIYDIIMHAGPIINGIDITPEDLTGKLYGTAKIGISKKQSRKLLESIDLQVKSTITSLITAMAAKTDNF